MKFTFVSLFPQMIEQALNWGVIGKALENQKASVRTLNPRNFTSDVHKTVDDRPYGGGDGMVMLYEPVAKALQEISELPMAKKIYLSPRGRLLNEDVVMELSQSSSFVLLCGRYGGVDHRVISEFGFEELSVGDYVVSGGELPALTLMDALLRKQPGVLGNAESAKQDSLSQGEGFEAPLFSRPQKLAVGHVPEVLLSGDHAKIAEFRRLLGLVYSEYYRPGWLEISDVDREKMTSLIEGLSDEELKALGCAEFLCQ